MSEKAFEMWAVLELMGHRRLAGYLTEQEIAGKGFIRIDVPSDPPATQFYSPTSVYAITPVTEETARRAATIGQVAPVNAWEMRLPASTTEAEDVDIDDDRECGVVF